MKKTIIKFVIYFVVIPILLCFLFAFLGATYDAAYDTKITGTLPARICRIVVIQLFGFLWALYLYCTIKLWIRKKT